MAKKWHAMSSNEVLAQLNSSETGLAKDEVQIRLDRIGPNKLPTPQPPTLLQIFGRQFLNPLIYILLAAAAVSLAIGEASDTLFIFVVLAFNACIGSYQEWKAERSSAALMELFRTQARVRRAGLELIVSANVLVPGDIVLLESGVKVPADLRFLTTNGLAIDEALLTGESVASDKRSAPLPEETALGDRKNMGFAGSTVTVGRGVGVVVETGERTELGNIARAVTDTEISKPPLIVRMERFTHQISYIILGACLLLGIYEVQQGKNIHDVFLILVALAVSAIPEGLPIAMTVALSVATQRMARRNVIVRKLTAVEGLGSCTCIASDKTGTLTLNKQTIRQVFLYPSIHLEVTGEGYNSEGKVFAPQQDSFVALADPELLELAKVGTLCNEASLVFNGSEWESAGDSVDLAFLSLTYKLSLQPHTIRESVELLTTIPFESERKYSAQFYRENGKVKVAVKGAVESIVPMCGCDWDHVRSCSPLDASRIELETLNYTKAGYRVLALAVGEVPDCCTDNLEVNDIVNLEFLGLVALIDPLRPEALVAVEQCQRAGIKVLMVTGDHPLTAFSIGKDLQIIESEQQLVNGTELADLKNNNPLAYQKRILTAAVFARVTPLQKLDIVGELMQAGNFVAVTGDGANDAPALRRANIGVAMGSGTDLAKENASIIVSDDNFASIVAGVEEGRYAYDSLRRVIWFLISNGFGLIVFFTIALFGAGPVPLIAVQLLWLNLVANGLQDVALAFEKGETGSMNVGPRSPQEGIFNRDMVEKVLAGGGMQALICLVAWYWLLGQGIPEATARNQLLLLLICMGNLQVLSCRSEKLSVFRIPFSRNWTLIAGVLFTHLLHLFATHNSVLQQILSLEPVQLGVWLQTVFMALPLVAAMEIQKWVAQRRSKLSAK